VTLRRRLLVGAVLTWMALIAFMDWLTMSPAWVSYVSSQTNIPFVDARNWLHSMVSAPLHAP